MLADATKKYWPVIDYFCRLQPDFILVGGTALALRLKHRVSFDFDLFTFKKLEPEKILQDFFAAHRDVACDPMRAPQLAVVAMEENQIHLAVEPDGIKVTLLKYPYRIRMDKKIGQMKIAHLEDIFAMKLYALLKRIEYKDFYDLAFLVKKFGLRRGLRFLNQMIAPVKIDSKVILAQLGQVRDLVAGCEETILQAKMPRQTVEEILEKEILAVLNLSTHVPSRI
jgi:hypothetical protein